jgi:NAD(P)-dependent dehydrogenase (short-subunit alcohol dehydrogenase family)
MFDLTGRKALVTGATGGIGEEIARALHAQGATLGLHGTRREKLEALAAELGGDTRSSPPTSPTALPSRNSPRPPKPNSAVSISSSTMPASPMTA